MKQISVLIVENSESDEELLLLKLTRAGYEVNSERVESAAQMKKALIGKKWDIIISDYEMPSFNGMEAHRILQESGLDIPFIIVSGSIGEDIAVEAMLAGVNDYLMKDNIARLVPAIERELKSAKDRKAQRIAEQSLKENIERYRSLFENANDTIFTVDLEGNFTFVNKQGEKLFGYSREEILKLKFTDYLNEEDENKVRELVRKKRENFQGDTRYEVEITTKSGEKRIVEVSSRLNSRNEVPYEVEGIARDITERKKLENDLQESAKRLDLALGSAKMGVWQWDFDTNAVYWSPECQNIIGVKNFGGTFDHFEEILYPEDKESLMDAVTKAIETHEIYNADFRSINDAGEILWLSNHGVAEYDSDGKPIRLIGTVRNITNRKLLEHNLIATEARFRTLAENSVAGVTLCLASGELIFVNDAYLEIVGYSREDFENGLLKWNEITSPKFHQEDRKSIEKAREKGKSKQYEKEYIRKDGSRVPVLVVIAATEIEGEEYFISTILDFTERKKAETELHESVEDFRALVEATSQVVWTIENGVGNSDFSDFWSELTGQTYEQSQGLGWLDVVHPEDREIAALSWNQSFVNNTQFNIVYRVLTVKGSYNYYAVRGVPVFNNEGNLRKWIGTFSDITERKEVEKKLIESESRLQLSQEAGRIGTWDWNFVTGEIIFSDILWSLYGLKSGEKPFTYDMFKELAHPDDLEFVEAAFLKMRDETDTLDIEFRIINNENQIVWLTSKARLIRDRNGEPERAIGINIDITARKNFEEELRESESRLQLSQEAGRVGTYEWNLVTGEIIFSDIMKSFYGIKPGEETFTYEMFQEFAHPEDLDFIETEVTKMLDGTDALDIEYRIIKKDNQVAWLASKGRVIRDKDGEVEKVVGINLDITERKNIEEDLRQSEERLQLSQDAGRVGTWEMNFLTNELIWSDIVWEFHGLEKNEIHVGFENWTERIHPDDIDYVQKDFEATLKHKDIVDVEFRIIKKDGQIGWVASKGRAIRDSNGKPERAVGITTDITERKAFEQELRRSEERLRLSQEAARIGTWEWNVETNETVWSVGVWAQFALEFDSIVTNYENYMKFVHPEDIKSLEDALQDSVNGGKALDIEYRIKNNDGQTLWIAAKGSVVRNNEGKIKRMIGVTIDVTDRKIAEESLQSSEEKLRQAQKLESIGRLAGGIAHDFNNMLTAINGYSDLTLRKMKMNDPFRGFIEEIRKSGERSAALTHQLLAFSRRQILQPKVLNINEIIADTTIMLQRLIGEDVRLIEKFSSDIGQIKADPGQMTQVIMNLAVNSRDAMPKGGSLTIETKNVYLDSEFVKENPSVAEGKYILLKFSDTGTGIDEEILENIFEPFFTTKKVGTGTGLGLATVYGIIKQSDGHISVKSVVGVGTVFEIYLPQVEVETKLPEKSDQNQILLNGIEKILVVEDEEIVRKLTCEILESYGYTIIEAKNGEDALEIFDSNEHIFDLLLTDVIMPKMGGHELAEKILEKHPKMRILFTSGYTEDSLTSHEIDDSVSDFIHKPFTPESLALKVRKILESEK